MKDKWYFRIFLLIFVIGIILRFYQLGNVPGSLDWDEVSFGYNAYSVLHTGKDEYGISHPLIFRAFGEYKQPVYAYLSVISIGLFGLNAFAVRFPSAFFGSLSIIFVYLMTYELFKKYKFVKRISLLSMAFYAISPWSIQFSRIGFEANVALALTIIAVWLFLKGLSLKNQWYFYGSIILLCLTELTYISLKLIAPLLFLALVVYGRSFLKKQKIILVVVFLLFMLGSALGYLNLNSLARGQDVLFTNQQTELLSSSIIQLQAAKEQHNIIGIVIYNRRVIYAEKYMENYLAHYNPVWLFSIGDTVDRHHAPGVGDLYLVSFPFILLGIYFLVSEAFAVSWIIFFWFLVAPLASSLTSDAPSALRSLIFLPTWQIFEAAGVIFLFQKFKRKTVKIIAIILILSLYTVNVCYYIHQYYSYTNTNTDYEKAWQYGYREADLYINRYNNTGKRVIFDSDFEQPYIFYLFYTKYDPGKYLAQGGSWRITKSCFTINNVYFGNCEQKLRNGDIHVILGENPSQKGIIVKRITYADGEPAVTIYQQ
jgi:4-amino-4-deoxy-L-arabinose transferase-like glycosyltransferase